jgi:hypothetical protein
MRLEEFKKFIREVIAGPEIEEKVGVFTVKGRRADIRKLQAAPNTIRSIGNEQRDANYACIRRVRELNIAPTESTPELVERVKADLKRKEARLDGKIAACFDAAAAAAQRVDVLNYSPGYADRDRWLNTVERQLLKKFDGEVLPVHRE